MKLNDEAVKRFFDYAKERYEIFLRRQAGRPWPWTEDKILQDYRFCNVFREDDVVTKWVKRYVRDVGRPETLTYRLCVARLVNRIEALEDIDTFGPGWEPELVEHALRKRARSNLPLVTAAYIVKTPNGKDKAGGLFQILRPIYETRDPIYEAAINKRTLTLERAHSYLTQFPYIGGFIAYEVVTDLSQTPLLSGATDINTWCHCGPGATRGAARILGLGPEARLAGKDTLAIARRLLDVATFQRWPVKWPQWTMREVEHTLCEFDKYERARLGEGAPKQRYRRPA